MAIVEFSGGKTPPQRLWVCSSCQRTIAATETAFEWGDGVLCPECCVAHQASVIAAQQQQADPLHQLAAQAGGSPAQRASRSYSRPKSQTSLTKVGAIVILCSLPVCCVPVIGLVGIAGVGVGVILLLIGLISS